MVKQRSDLQSPSDDLWLLKTSVLLSECFLDENFKLKVKHMNQRTLKAALTDKANGRQNGY